MKTLKLSALDLAPVLKGGNAQEAIQNTVETAQKVESLGYERIWVAEHHNMEYIASSATAVLMGHLAGNTKSIKIGSGGIMLPNHAPLVVAEQMGTLASIYPNRIDLGLGRAPGTDQLTAMALRRNNMNTQFYFKDDVLALQKFFSKNNYTAKVRAFPGEGLEIPIWILGSSTDSAYLAAELGLPYAFASHFAPAQLAQASQIYRENFKASEQLSSPYFVTCVNIVGADSNEDAELLKTSLFNLFAGIVTNNRFPLSPPTEVPIYDGIPEIERAVNSMVSGTFIGNKEKLKKEIQEFVDTYQVDELMGISYIYDLGKKMRSFEILREAFPKG
ncbi:MAG TPA: LLM class flavin-dependent oxidoreductase [Sphingobacterium sp.]|nr:LLM class flavin-dependent oxidoreductase [Sphingobacterium sp.]